MGYYIAVGVVSLLIMLVEVSFNTKSAIIYTYIIYMYINYGSQLVENYLTQCL